MSTKSTRLLILWKCVLKAHICSFCGNKYYECTLLISWKWVQTKYSNHSFCENAYETYTIAHLAKMNTRSTRLLFLWNWVLTIPILWMSIKSTRLLILWTWALRIHIAHFVEVSTKHAQLLTLWKRVRKVHDWYFCENEIPRTKIQPTDHITRTRG